VASLPYKFVVFLMLFVVIFWIIGILILSIVSIRPIKQLSLKCWILLFILGYIFNILVAECSGIVFKIYVVGEFVKTTSMSPTLTITSDFRDLIIINKWIYKLQEPQRGDIVCFYPDNWLLRDENKRHVCNIKRIVGMPNETIDIEPPYILINGNRLTEPLIFETISLCQNGYNGYYKNNENELLQTITMPLTLGKDQYFVMGDNSYHSIDSRQVGAIHRNDIQGKVIRIIYPLSRFKFLN
jgi:signal peptidase I